MQRRYAETANSYAPLRQVWYLQGLGSNWPEGRSYWDVSHFRSPYEKGHLQYYQNGSLLGLGAAPPGLEAAIQQNAPPSVKRFLLSGEPVPAWRTNIGLAFNQVSPWVYGLLAAGALATSYFSYQRFKKGTKAPKAQ